MLAYARKNRRTAFLTVFALTALSIYLTTALSSLSSRQHVYQLFETHLNINIDVGSWDTWSDLASLRAGGGGGGRSETVLRYEDGVAYATGLGREHPMEELFRRGQEKADKVQRTIESVRQGGLGAAVRD